MKNITVCKSCYNKNRRKNKNQQPKIDKTNSNENNNPNVSTYVNHAYVVIGPSNGGKTYYMLRMLEKKGDQRQIPIITRSPNQYPNYKTSNENKPINKYKGSVVVFDDMLGALNSSELDKFYTTRDRQEYLSAF